MDLLLIISILSAAIPVIVGVVRKQFSLLWFYPLTGLVFDILNSLIRRVWHLNNGITANTFIYLEFILLLCLYRKAAFKRAGVFYVVTVGLSIFYLANTISNDAWVFNMFGGSVFMLVYIFLSIVGLYTILKTKQVVFLEKSSDYWFYTAILIYSGGAFLIFLFKQYMVNANVQGYMSIWKSFFYPLNITKNILLALSIYHLNKQRQFEH